MSHPSASITIDAPLAVVWEIMLDTARYGEWNPFVERVECRTPPEVGDPIVLHVRWANREDDPLTRTDQRDRCAHHRGGRRHHREPTGERRMQRASVASTYGSKNGAGVWQ
jgi:hypothetical protein